MKKKLCIYITAGFPHLESTGELIRILDDEQVDYIEVGMPYSDPLADGLTIQHTSKIALENGMKLDILFDQLREVKNEIQTPIIYMGYVNPVLRYGVERYLDAAKSAGIIGCILPDLPMEIYKSNYLKLFKEKGIGMNFLVSPGTAANRIIEADTLSDQYLYVISQNTITGTPKDGQRSESAFFNSLQEMPLKSERLIGFGIKNRQDLEHACKYADGAIIGSAFLNAIKDSNDLRQSATDFIRALRN